MKSTLIVLLAAVIMSSVHAQSTFGPSTEYSFLNSGECNDKGYMKFDSQPQSFSVHATKNLITTGVDEGKLEYDITSVTLSRCPSELSSTDQDVTQISPVLIHNNIYYKLSDTTGGTGECSLSIEGIYEKNDPDCGEFCALNPSSSTTKFVASVGDLHLFNLGYMYNDGRQNVDGTPNNQYQETVFGGSSCTFIQAIPASECGTNYYANTVTANGDTTNLCTQCSTVICDSFKQVECTSTTDAFCCQGEQFAVNGICTDNHCRNVVCETENYVLIQPGEDGTTSLNGPIIENIITFNKQEMCCGLMVGDVFHSSHDLERMKNTDCPTERNVRQNEQDTALFDVNGAKAAYATANGCTN